jgi:hypothetical protein
VARRNGQRFPTFPTPTGKPPPASLEQFRPAGYRSCVRWENSYGRKSTRDRDGGTGRETCDAVRGDRRRQTFGQEL